MGFNRNMDFGHRFRIFLKRWFPFLIGCGLILIVVVISALLHNMDREFQISEPTMIFPTELIENTLKDILVAHRTLWEGQERDGGDQVLWTARVPADLPIPSLHLAIQEGLADIDGEILYGESDPLSDKISLYIGCQDSCLFILDLVSSPSLWRDTGKIALLIDDFGARWDTFVKSFFELPGQINISVIPGCRLSKKVASEAEKRGCEVILHLPMEPIKSDYKDNGYTILTTMTKLQMEKVIKHSLSDVPGVVGVNNHMGSKVTSDQRAITAALEVIKLEGLYFLDSRTTAASVAYQVAQELGLRCGQRDLFLDADPDKASIQRSLNQLVQKAKNQGFAIGIGHCHRNMLEILRDEMPRIQEKGYRFVRLSEVIR